MSASNPLAATLLTLLIAAAPAASAEVQPRVFVPRQPGTESPWLQSQLREIDNHYAAQTQEMQQQLHQAIETMKQQPTAEQLNALRDAIGHLESQVKQLGTTTTRMENGLNGFKNQLDMLQSAAKPAPTPAITETGDTEFERAMTALRTGDGDIEPMRRWTEQHRTDPKAPDGYLQLGLHLLVRNHSLGEQYLRRVVNDYPTSPQAVQAKYFLAGAPAPKAKPAKPPAKVVKHKTAAPVTPPVPDMSPANDEPATPAPVHASKPDQTNPAKRSTAPENTSNKKADKNQENNADEIEAIHIKPPAALQKDKHTSIAIPFSMLAEATSTSSPTPAEAADAQFEQALTALHTGSGNIAPMRLWIEQHRTHPKVPEGYLQMATQLLARNPILAQLYLKRVINNYPRSSQATQAQRMLANATTPKTAPATHSPSIPKDTSASS